jgi:hypothetical protein
MAILIPRSKSTSRITMVEYILFDYDPFYHTNRRHSILGEAEITTMDTYIVDTGAYELVKVF